MRKCMKNNVLEQVQEKCNRRGRHHETSSDSSDSEVGLSSSSASSVEEPKMKKERSLHPLAKTRGFLVIK